MERRYGDIASFDDDDDSAPQKQTATPSKPRRTAGISEIPARVRDTVRRTLKTYFTPRLRPAGKNMFHGGSIFPPHIEPEVDVTVRCPEDVRATLTMAACRVHTNTQFNQDQLLFHGTADPECVPFPTASQDHLRWYAFDPNMSLDYIREETQTRQTTGKPCRPTMYVYRIVKPIRNMLLFADGEQWLGLGGAQELMNRGICGITIDTSTARGRARHTELLDRATALGCPLEEYLRAVGVTKFRIMRGSRAEHANGWVRINSIGILGSQSLASKGFEMMLTHPNHSEYLELLYTYNVIDATAEFGVVDRDTRSSLTELEWHMAAFSPVKRRLSMSAVRNPPSPTARRLSM